jgi:hypothetical protein
VIDDVESMREVLAGTDCGEHEMTTIKLNSGELIFSVALGCAEEVLPMWSAARSVLEQTGRWPVLTPHYADPPELDVHRRRAQWSSEPSDTAIADAARVALSEIRDERERVWPSRPMIDGLEQELEKTRFYFGEAPSRDEVLKFVPADASPAARERWLLDWERGREPTGRTRGGDHMRWFFQPGDALRFFPVSHGPDTLAYAPPFCGVPGNSLERMIAILEHWETRYGAELVANHGTMLQWVVSNPPRTLEECWELTVQHELVAPDTFTLPAISMREHARELLGRTT